MTGHSDGNHPADGSFLTGSNLSEAVLHVMGGRDRRCAVAFWGKGMRDFIERSCPANERTRIICDISMGGCHPDALRAFGAPGNADLRYRDKLHAKVYLSDRGAVIGSANASDNGLGFGAGGPGLVEAATFHAAGAKAWDAAAAWFDNLHAEAGQIDEVALARASQLFRPQGGTGEPRQMRPGSLLDIVVAHPERFNGIGFVLSSCSSTEKEKLAARKSAKKIGIDPEIITNTTDHDMFIGWETNQVLSWPVSFIEFWMPNDKLSLYARVVAALDPAAGNVFAKKGKRALRRLVTGDLPDFREAGRQDAATVALLVSEGGRVFRTAAELAAAIEELAVG